MKRGQGNVVGVVLLILIIIAAIVIISAVIIPLVKESGEETETGVGSISTALEIKNVEIYITGDVNVTVHRGSDKNNINGLNFIFYESDGSSNIVEARGENLISTTSSKVFNFNQSTIENEGKIEKVSVVPIIGNDLGIEIKESDSNILTNRDGERIYKNPEGLISWWRFDGNARDGVGSNHGELKCNGGGCVLPELVEDSERGGVVNFAVDEQRYVELTADLNDISNYGGANGASTLSAWVKVQDLAHYDYIFNDVAGARFFAIDFNGKSSARVGVDGGGTEISLSDTPITTEWAHVVLVINGKLGQEKVSRYLNGNPDGTDSTESYRIANFGKIPAIGKGLHSNSDSWFEGKIDDAMVFNRALSADEVKGLYINQKR